MPANWLVCTLCILAQLAGLPGPGLAQPSGRFLDWRPIGTSLIAADLASAASGPVTQAWFGAKGEIFARTQSAKIFLHQEPGKWIEASEATPPAPNWLEIRPSLRPETQAKVLATSTPGLLYAFGQHVYRSEDSGHHWVNLTQTPAGSIIGSPVYWLDVSPVDSSVIVAATVAGVWLSVDGGLSWRGLNDGLPNFPVKRILATPAGPEGLRVEVETFGVVEWPPGGKIAWLQVADPSASWDQKYRQELSARLDTSISTIASAGSTQYAGDLKGQIFVSRDNGTSWQLVYVAPGRQVSEIVTVAANPNLAVAALSARQASPAQQPLVLRTTDGGQSWDDLTANLAVQNVFGIAFEPVTGALYAATERGVYFTSIDPWLPSPPKPWLLVSEGLPPAPVMDVAVDLEGNQLYAAVYGYGVYTTLAPHRYGHPVVVHVANFQQAPVAPGDLLAILGQAFHSVLVNGQPVPLLVTTGHSVQLQLPFELSPGTVRLVAADATTSRSFSLPVISAMPMILVDEENSPLIIDAESQVFVDLTNPARAGSRLQVLATGLGQVEPEWPAGVPAPLQAPPRVKATVKAYLNQLPLEVTRATLAPGYIGLYLVEVQLPWAVNEGPAYLRLEVDSQPSPPVKIYVTN